MRGLADYHDDDPVADLASWHRVAEERARRRPLADPVITAAASELIAEGGHDDLLLGWVDGESWRRRDEFRSELRRRLAASILSYRSLAPYRRLFEDQLDLELLFRFPYLGDTFQAALAEFERAWGYRRDLAAEVEIGVGDSEPRRVARFVRATEWPAARADGLPLPETIEVHAGRLHAPRASPAPQDLPPEVVAGGFARALEALLAAIEIWDDQLRRAFLTSLRDYDRTGSGGIPWAYLRIRPVDRQR
jgi:hypothetical protein